MFTLNYNGKLLVIDKPIVMGIINATPDSFYPGSRIQHTDDILYKAENMLNDGAVILDVGGQSTRPGSEQVGAEEELKRVIPAIEAITKNFPKALISVDTFYASVLKAAVEAGANIANDVSAGSIDDELLPMVASLKVPYVLMHMKGHPQTMQMNPVYDNVVTEVFDALNIKKQELKQSGINDIIIDPGFGFGKTIQHNFQLLKGLSFFKEMEAHLLVGVSRKSTVYKTLQVTPEEALNGTTVLHTIALLNGASILRVHDVKEACEAIRLVNEYLKYEEQF